LSRSLDYSFLDEKINAQRLAAQPLGRFRYVITILAGNLQSETGVLSLSLGQVGCSRGLGGHHLQFFCAILIKDLLSE
jgi:hypothetical protein